MHLLRVQALVRRHGCDDSHPVDEFAMRRRPSLFVVGLSVTAGFMLATIWVFESRSVSTIRPNMGHVHNSDSSSSRALGQPGHNMKSSNQSQQAEGAATATASHREMSEGRTRKLVEIVRRADESIEALEKKLGVLEGNFDKREAGVTHEGQQDERGRRERGVNEAVNSNSEPLRMQVHSPPSVLQVQSQSERGVDSVLSQNKSRHAGYGQREVPKLCQRVPTVQDFFPAADYKYPVLSERKLIVIVTTMRSGSSFFGTMLDQSDETLYIFEPFWYLEFVYRKREYWDDLKVELLRSMSTCRFDKGIAKDVIGLISRSFKFARSYSNALIEPPLCPDNCTTSCPPIDVELLNRVCLSKRAVVIKTIRLYDMAILEKVHEDSIATDPEFSGTQPAQLQIIHLVRDPRGTMNSRLSLRGELERHYIVRHPDHNIRHLDHNIRHLPPFHDVVASDAEALCDETMSHINLASQDPDWLHGRYRRVLFEDLAKHTYEEMIKLLISYQLIVTDKLRKWIQWNTQASSPGGYAYGTRRKSVAVPQKWRVMLDRSDKKQFVNIIEQKCHAMMRTLGYIPVFPDNKQ